MSTPRRLAALAAAAVMLSITACQGGFTANPTSSSATSHGAPVAVSVVIASSGPTELKAVQDAAQGWARSTGNAVTVTSSAELWTELAKGFAGGAPPDLFYVDPAHLGAYATAGSLHAYGDQLPTRYIDTLRRTFTYNGTFWCAPKDFSTLALVIDEKRWAAAALTDADIPKDWAGLESVAKRLTTSTVTGLVVNADADRVGVFLRQAGGWWTNEDGTTMTARSEENVAALTEVKRLLTEGSMKFTSELGLTWGGEALQRGKAAMTIEGNWITGALKDDPNLHVRIVELPAGPKGRGTLSFTNCWGIGSHSAHPDAARDLVAYLSQDDQQLASAKAFGVMPATQSAMERFTLTAGPLEPFAASARYAHGPVTSSALVPVLADLSARLPSLRTADPTALLDRVQKDGETALTP